MKLVVCLGLFVQSLSCLAKETTVEVIVMDMYSDERVTDCYVEFWQDQRQMKVEVDAAGKASLNIFTKSVDLNLISHSGNYKSLSYTVEIGKAAFQRVILYLSPAKGYKNSLTLEEDRLYGTLDAPDKHVLELPIENGRCDELIESSYEGGAAAMQRYIMQNVNYPLESIERKEQGKVYLSFVVETDGSISHIQVERGASMHLDREAVRLIRSMPPWKPGTCDSEIVRLRVRIPINFTLN